MTRLLCIFLLAVFAATSVSAKDLIASVDRSTLSVSETVELSLESDDTTLFGKPDLKPLNELFDVLGTRQVNRLTTLNGEAKATTRWIVTLQPKTTGTVVIPSLSLEDMHSQPITLQVVEASKDANSSKMAPVFIDASLDKDSVYVQEQAVLTLRIYHSVSLYDDSSLTPLEIPDARVEPLEKPRTYEKLINGVRHGVIELRYAIYPQHSGALEIPSQAFSATAVAANDSDDYNPFGPRPGKVVRVRSPQIPLEVKAKPASYPADAPWLPAHKVTLTESWSPDPASAKVGDSLTRNMMLNVEGLSSAQLPPLATPDVKGLRRYPDQPSLSNQVTPQGITGSREEHEALVPNQQGKVELPAITLTWWNTLTDSLEQTSIPARTLDVAANPQLTEPQIPVEALPPTVIQGPAVWPWQLSTALLGLTTFIALGLWWRARRLPAVSKTAQTGPSPRTLLDELKRACQANEPNQTRQALDAWARQQPCTLAEMAARDVPLSAALDELNGALYSETGQQWQGEALWQAIRSLPALETQQPATLEASALPPLYPR
ncbi:protein BatD [Pseudomonas sp. J237]|nr:MULTISPECIES: BatD family protein [Pseudomonas]OEO26401.1 protein BatD [Pseudomonas sp. J237]